MSALQDTVDYPMPPGEIAGPSAWYGPDMAARPDEWIRPFSEAELDELDSAMRSIRARGINIIDIDREAFPLPTLSPVLEDIRHEVLEGRGFVLLRGIPVERYTIEESAIVYFGLGAHFGVAVPQNALGHGLGHVKDLGYDVRNTDVRIYQTTARQTFHTDACDVVGLMCLQPAKKGGLSSIVSTDTLYNEMRRRRSDLLPHLFRPYATDWRNEAPDGGDGHYEVPIFHWFAGRLSTRHARPYVDSAQRFDDVAPLTDEALEALDLFDALAEDPAIHLKMEFHKGDIQLLHNHQILHDRTEYEDWDEPERRRHLLRLWLCARGGRPLPETYLPRFFNLEIGSPQRGGYLLPPGRVLNAPLEAE